MKSFQLVIEGTFEGESADAEKAQGGLLLAAGRLWVGHLSEGVTVRAGRLNLASPSGHHEAASESFDLLAKEEEAQAAPAVPVAESEAPAGETPLAAAGTAAPPAAPPAPEGGQ